MRQPKPRAFMGIVRGLNDNSPGIVAAVNAGRARYRIYLAANDAGRKVRFQDIVIKRAPKFDPIAAELDAARGTRGLEWAETMLKATEKEKAA